MIHDEDIRIIDTVDDTPRTKSMLDERRRNDEQTLMHRHELLLLFRSYMFPIIQVEVVKHSH